MQGGDAAQLLTNISNVIGPDDCAAFGHHSFCIRIALA